MADPWRYPGEPAGEADALIAPCAALCERPEPWLTRPAALGVHLAPADDPGTLRTVLPRIGLIAVEFPNVVDGRGFTQAAILRRWGFTGELRAVGAGVKQDLIFLMARCGCDAFELAPGERPELALRALRRYSVAYQGGEPLQSIKQVRFER